MKIIIAGAGDIGFHLADLLSIENQDITLIDTDKEVLNFAETHLDIFSIRGDASSVEVLERAEVHKARLFIAVTTSEQTNLLASIIAKKMGAKQTIARVNKSEYIRQNGKIINFKELGIDTLISPPFLAAKEISRLIRRNQLTDVFEFENGRLSLIGLAIDEKARIADKAVMAVAENNPNCVFRPIAILRDEETIIPRGNTMLRKNDHVYFIAENKADLCASVQYTIIETLLLKLKKAIATYKPNCIALAGGVSANSALRAAITQLGEELNLPSYIPSFEYCTDNAAMIGISGYYKFLNNDFCGLEVTAQPRLKV